MKDTLLKALNWRYAVQVFDPTKQVSDEDLQTILECGRLSPSSFGIEAWKFIVVDNPDVRKKLRAVGMDQPKITDASRLIVIAYRTNAKETISQERVQRVAKVRQIDEASLGGLKQMIDGFIASKTEGEVDAWVKAQSYIPLGMMLEAAALMGIDGGPMEGFLPDKVDEVLGLSEQNLHATSMLALGYRGNDPVADMPKVRQTFDEVVTFVK